MTNWSTEELEKIGAAEELEIQSRRSDGSLRRPVTIWVVRQGTTCTFDQSRAGAGAGSPARRTSTKVRIRAGDVGKDVTFVDGDAAVNDGVDAAYRAKYRGPNAQYVPSVLTEGARASTLKLVPRS